MGECTCIGPHTIRTGTRSLLKRRDSRQKNVTGVSQASRVVPSHSLFQPHSSQQREGVVGCGVETGLLRSTHLDLLTVLPWHRCMTVDPRYFTSLSLSFISCWKGDNLTCLKVAVRISYSYESTLKQKRDPLKFVMF